MCRSRTLKKMKRMKNLDFTVRNFIVFLPPECPLSDSSPRQPLPNTVITAFFRLQLSNSQILGGGGAVFLLLLIFKLIITLSVFVFICTFPDLVMFSILFSCPSFGFSLHLVRIIIAGRWVFLIFLWVFVHM